MRLLILRPLVRPQHREIHFILHYFQLFLFSFCTSLHTFLYFIASHYAPAVQISRLFHLNCIYAQHHHDKYIRSSNYTLLPLTIFIIIILFCIIHYYYHCIPFSHYFTLSQSINWHYKISCTFWVGWNFDNMSFKTISLPFG